MERSSCHHCHRTGDLFECFKCKKLYCDDECVRCVGAKKEECKTCHYHKEFGKMTCSCKNVYCMDCLMEDDPYIFPCRLCFELKCLSPYCGCDCCTCATCGHYKLNDAVTECAFCSELHCADCMFCNDCILCKRCKVGCICCNICNIKIEDLETCVVCDEKTCDGCFFCEMCHVCDNCAGNCICCRTCDALDPGTKCKICEDITCSECMDCMVCKKCKDRCTTCKKKAEYLCTICEKRKCHDCMFCTECLVCVGGECGGHCICCKVCNSNGPTKACNICDYEICSKCMFCRICRVCTSKDCAITCSCYPPRICNYCEVRNNRMKTCAGCEKVRYCSRECQINDRDKHRDFCVK